MQIGEVKVRLALRLGCAPAALKIVYRGKTTNDDLSIDSLRLRENETLVVMTLRTVTIRSRRNRSPGSKLMPPYHPQVLPNRRRFLPRPPPPLTPTSKNSLRWASRRKRVNLLSEQPLTTLKEQWNICSTVILFPLPLPPTLSHSTCRRDCSS
jgi:hypothetical protein